MRRHTKPRGLGAIAFAVAGLVLVPFAVTASAAGWVDVEHDNASVAAADCAAATGFVSSGAGRLVSGSLLGVDLDPIVAVNGASASNTGSSSSAEVSAPLDASAVGLHLAGALRLDAGAQAGVLQQFARATSAGYSAGAAGAVTDSGAIALAPPAGGQPVPQFATLRLGEVLDAVTGAGLGGGVAGLADVSLAVGALASYATLDGCAADWNEDAAANLEREYLIAGLSTRLTSPRVGSLVSTTNAGLTNIDALVAATAGNTGLVNAVSGAVLSGLSTTLAAFVKGTPTTTIALDVNFSSVQSLLTNPIPDALGVLSIDLSGGTVTVDLAALLGPSYQDSVGLNGLAPNTQLLVNATALSALVSRVDVALTAWVGQLTTAINAAISVLRVDLLVSVPIAVGVAGVGTVNVGAVNVSATNVSLAALKAGTAPISTTLALTPPSCAGITGALVCGVVNPLLGTLTTAVTALVLNAVVGPVVGTAIQAALTPVPGLATLLANLEVASDALLGLLSSSLGALFGPSAVLSLVANAQDTLAAGSSHPFRTGAYSVSALRLVTLGVLGGGVRVELARSIVGSNGPG